MENRLSLSIFEAPHQELKKRTDQDVIISLKIAVNGEPDDAKLIRQLMSPWEITITDYDDAEIHIEHGSAPSGNRSIVIPCNHKSAGLVTNGKRLTPSGETQKISVPVTRQVSLTILPKILYSIADVSGGDLPTNDPTFSLRDNTEFFRFDLIAEYKRILIASLNGQTAFAYRLFCGLPFSYQLAPKKIRDMFMRSNSSVGFSFSNSLPLDALRFSLANSIEKLAKTKLQRKKNSKSSYVLTHDIETASGLQSARVIKKIEEKYDVPSAWYIPSNSYSLDYAVIRQLSNHGEVGVHGTKHDGRLLFMSKVELEKAFAKAKRTLEKGTNSCIQGFRAPLLQHSSTIFDALRTTEYVYDSSIPTWEPKHPRTMGSYGLGTVFPFSLAGMKEIPITVMQDHQLLHVLGLEPQNVIKYWLSTSSLIAELGGICVFLSHPEYEILSSLNASLYEDFLNNLTDGKDVVFSTPLQIAQKVTCC